MKNRLTLSAAAACAAAQSLALTAALPASAGEPAPHRLGDHPAVVVQRLHQAAGYDYASKFYPHPAWLYLSATPPSAVEDDPAASARSGRGAEPGAPTGPRDAPLRTASARR